MNKKLTLLAAGVMAALAFAALPAFASAGELQAHCEGAPTCTGEITAGAGVPIELQNAAGQKISCTGLSGNTSFTSTTTTGTANLSFTGCKETVTVFKFSCNSTGAAAGVISANNLTFHLVNLESAASPTPGIAFTNINVTFECTGFSKKRVTGNVLGDIEGSPCNTSQSTQSITFQKAAAGVPNKYTQITTTGTVLDLISSPDDENYTTSAQEGTGIVHWSNPVKITC